MFRTLLSLTFGCLAFSSLSLAIGQEAKPAVKTPDATTSLDWDRARALFQRYKNGEKLSADDDAYLKLAIEAREERRRTSTSSRPDANRIAESSCRH